MSGDTETELRMVTAGNGEETLLLKTGNYLVVSTEINNI